MRHAAAYAAPMGTEDKKLSLPWSMGSKSPLVESDDEYLQDMSHEDIQSLAAKLKGYGETADPLRELPS